MIQNIVNQTRTEINTLGHSQKDNRMQRPTRALNGHQIIHHYLESPDKTPQIKEKYVDDWGRMYRTMTKTCEELTKDPFSRRAVIFNTTKYEKVYPCFLTMHVIHNENGEYDMLVYQRSADLEKLEDDISYFEYVMYKVGKRVEIKVNRLIITYGSIHYTTTE